MSKYYTPEPEEFHYGFEFEYSRSLDGGWVPTTYNEKRGLLGVRGKHVNPDEIRVKYLDKEDLESMGYKTFESEIIEDAISAVKNLDGERDVHICTSEALFSKGYVEGEISIYMERPVIEGLDIISIMNGCTHVSDLLFKGKIKNKSELKKLLKQLGI